MNTDETESNTTPRNGNREHLAHFRNGRRRIDYYIAPAIIPKLEDFLARYPGTTASAMINGVIEYAHKKHFPERMTGKHDLLDKGIPNDFD